MARFLELKTGGDPVLVNVDLVENIQEAKDDDGKPYCVAEFRSATLDIDESLAELQAKLGEKGQII